MSFTTRFAFALAAGLWIGVGGLALSGAGSAASAAASSVSTQKAAKATPSEGRKRTAGRSATKSSAKSTAAAAAATGAAAVAATGAAAAETPNPAISEAIANAHAQMSDAHTEAVPMAPAVAEVAEAEVVASDQLNELDRQATAEKPRRGAAIVQPAADNATLWDKTSLIGKIFIAFGALLTAASAARLAIA